MIRVAMVVDRFPNETFLAQHVAALIDAGVDVHVLCQIFDRASPACELLAGVDLESRVHPWPERDEPVRRVTAAIGAVVAGLGRAPRDLVAAGRTESWHVGRTLFDARVVAVDPDVVHFQFADLALRRIHVRAARRVAFTASFRGYDLAYAGLDQPGYYDRLWPVLDGAHTLGDDLRRGAVERGCPPDLRWTIIPPGVDLDRLQPGDRLVRLHLGRAEPVRLLSVGRLHWKKGYLDALDAVAQVARTGRAVEYRIVGGGDDIEPIRWAIADLGLANVVELVGPVGPRQVRDHLQWADVFLHAALTEGFGNAVLEAQAMALPVVCTDAEGLGENVANGVTGFVVPRRRPASLADKIVDLADDPGLRQRMGSAGRRRVEAGFGLDRQTASFVEFFTAALERRRSRQPR